MQVSFLDTVESVPDGAGFAYFGPEHCLWLAAGVAFWVLLCRGYRRARADQRRTMRLAVAWLIVADECFKHATLLLGHHWWANYLPLQLCSLSIFICLWNALRPRELNRQLIYAVAVPAALAALLFPGWARVPAWSAQAIHSFTVHVLIVGYGVMQLSGHDIKPRPKWLPACLGATGALAVAIYFLNKALGTNFMFLANPGDAWPLTAWEQALGAPGYILPLALVAAAMISAMYLPGMILGAVHRLRERPRASRSA